MSDNKNLEKFVSAMEAAFDVDIPEEHIKEEELCNEEIPSSMSQEDIISYWTEGNFQEYESPGLKKLSEAVKGACRGTVSEEELKDVIEETENKLNKTMEEFSRITGALTPETFTGQEEAKIIKGAFELHKKAINKMKNYFQEKESDELLDGLEMARIATGLLYKSFCLLEKVETGEEEGSSGEGNEKSEKFRKVKEKYDNLNNIDKNTLDFVMGERKLYTSPHLDKIIKETRLLLSGEIKKEKFSSTLKWMKNNIKESKEQYGEINSAITKSKDFEVLKGYFPDGKPEFMEELFSYMEDILKKYEEAVDEMEMYLSDNNSFHLGKGMGIMLEANSLIAKIQEF